MTKNNVSKATATTTAAVNQTIRPAKYRLRHDGFRTEGFVGQTELEAKTKYVTRTMSIKEGSKQFATAISNVIARVVRPAVIEGEKKATAKKAPESKKAESKTESGKPVCHKCKDALSAADMKYNREQIAERGSEDGYKFVCLSHIPNLKSKGAGGQSPKATKAKKDDSAKPASAPASGKHFSGGTIINREGKSKPSIKSPEGVITDFGEIPTLKEFLFALDLSNSDLTPVQKAIIKSDYSQFIKDNFTK